jgi:uncharacterized repeat protein (TIGR03803 family)
MALHQLFSGNNYRVHSCTKIFVTAMVVALAVSAHAQSFSVLHNFTGGADGGHSSAALTVDRAGNLVGVTPLGGRTGGPCGTAGCGEVFKLTHRGDGWTLTTLYSFTGGADGWNPSARVILGPNGTLYGTTLQGGNGFGVVFNLQPPARACLTVICPWTETVLYAFMGGSDGGYPADAGLAFDQAGNLYGTTPGSGFVDDGTVFKLTPAGGRWTETVLHRFTQAESPDAGVVFDNAGNIYSTTPNGGRGLGTVFELTPSGSGWVENTIYEFQNDGDGSSPLGGVTIDAAGNLYGATGILATVYELQPSNGNWTFSTLYSFSGFDEPTGPLTFDAAGNLYGTVSGGGSHGRGYVFRLTNSSGGWTESDLADFGSGGDPGGDPEGGVALDSNSNVYGTTSAGGAHGFGIAWEITQ